MKEIEFLESALTAQNQFQSLDSFKTWFAERHHHNRFQVTPIPFSGLDKWYFEDAGGDLVHESGRFFRVRGLRVKTNYGSVSQWEQPVIDQPEIGILGIIAKKFNGTLYFLMQAKMEPGNVNILQLSPTVQATKSNYTRAHKGKTPAYVEYFIHKDAYAKENRLTVLLDQLQTEHGGRFLRKRNRNIIIELHEDIPVYDDFHWLTLAELKHLMAIDNLVNMDARSVISCMAYADEDLKRAYDSLSPSRFCKAVGWAGPAAGFQWELIRSLLEQERALYTQDEILHWFTEMKTRYEMELEIIPLNKVRHWQQTAERICHEQDGHFEIIGVKVQAGNREVTQWTQPLFHQRTRGIIGFLAKKINGILHFLIQSKLEPGSFNLVEMAPTAECSEAYTRLNTPLAPPFLERFIAPSKAQVRYAAVQSDEGGRFYHNQNLNMVLEVDENEVIDHPENYRWMTLGQIQALIKHGYLNIDARSLLSCLILK